MSPCSFALLHWTPRGQSPHPGSGILVTFNRQRTPCFRMTFVYLLGPTDPYSTAAQMEPFLTSVFKVLVWICATTIKISTCGSSSRTHVRAFCTHCSGPPTCCGVAPFVHILPLRNGTSPTLQQHPFPALFDLEYQFLHTPYWIPTSMTTFMLSLSTNLFYGIWRVSSLRVPYRLIWFIPQPQFCLPKVANWALAFTAKLQSSESSFLPI